MRSPLVRPCQVVARLALAASVTLGLTLSLSLASCAASPTTPRHERVAQLLDVSSSIGLARHSAKWTLLDLDTNTYANAPAAELAALRGQAQSLRANADALDVIIDRVDMLKESPNDPPLADLTARGKVLERQRDELERELHTLQVRLGLRTPDGALTRTISPTTPAQPTAPSAPAAP